MLKRWATKRCCPTYTSDCLISFKAPAHPTIAPPAWGSRAIGLQGNAASLFLPPRLEWILKHQLVQADVAYFGYVLEPFSHIVGNRMDKVVMILGMSMK
jgi:hypothetical protein